MCLTAFQSLQKWFSEAGNANKLQLGADLAGRGLDFANNFAEADANRAQMKAELVQLDIQRQQLEANQADQLSDRARESLIESARIRTAAGESGIGGSAVSNILRDVQRSSGRDSARIKEQTKRSVAQNKAEASGVRATYANRTNPISLANVSKLVTGVGADAGAYNKRKTKR